MLARDTFLVPLRPEKYIKVAFVRVFAKKHMFFLFHSKRFLGLRSQSRKYCLAFVLSFKERCRVTKSNQDS